MGTGALAERLRSGDRAAFAEVYEEFAEPLLGLCLVLLRERGDAEDAMHDAFILAAQRIDQLRDPERLRPWLFAIARHVCFRRIAQRRRTTPMAIVPDIDLTEDDPTAALTANAAAELVWAAASGLNDRDRAALYLNTSQGLEGEELAAALGLQHANPHSLLSRARRQLDRAIGVLLVARDGRHDCSTLSHLLADWDGSLSPLLRKRLGRHIDACATCQRTRTRALALSAIGGIVPALAAQAAEAMPVALTGGELFDIAAHRAASNERWQADGFPPTVDRISRRRWLSVVVCLAVTVLAAIGLVTNYGQRHSAHRSSQRELDRTALESHAPTTSTNPAKARATQRLVQRQPTRPRSIRTPPVTAQRSASQPPATQPPATSTAPTSPAPAPTGPTVPATTAPVTQTRTPVTFKPTTTTTIPRQTTTTIRQQPTTTTTPSS